MTRIMILLAATALAVGFGAGCPAKKKEITELQRKEAALRASEAQFSLTMRNWAEAEAALAQAVGLDPDNGSYWISLGSMRMKLGRRAAAKEAYQGALRAFEAQAAKDKADSGPWLQQVYALLLLGRTADARSVLHKAEKQFPNQRNVRIFIEDKQLDRMLADPKFKDNAL